MHGWASNCTSILTNLNQSNDISKAQLFSDTSNDILEKILCLQWFNITDEFAFNFNQSKINHLLLNGFKKPTKREFLKIIMSIFDPLRFLTPFTMQSRILMQDIWTSGIGWNEGMCENEFVKWLQWLHDYKSVQSCRIDRCYEIRDQQVKSVELHIFCDASSKTYATVAYWRFILSNDSFHIAIIIAKGRVAPLKVISIPRRSARDEIIKYNFH